MSPRAVVLAAAALVAAGWAALAQPGASPAAAKAVDNLDGTWEIVSLIEDGKPVALEVVKQTVVKDARVVIRGPLLGFTRPDGKARTIAFVTDPQASPKTIDMAGIVSAGGKGIYMRDGSTLLLCLPVTAAEARPTEFAPLPGRDTILITLLKVTAPAAPVAAPVPPPAPPAAPPEDAVRKTLVGTWGHQTDELVFRITLNPDGTFSDVRTWKKGLKKLFDAEERASGTWKLTAGVVVFTTTAADDRKMVGQINSVRVQSINDSEVIYTDSQTGQRRIEWKLR